MCSLVQLLVDPHYRTISGFISLIKKEWLALGHPFASRIGLKSESERERGPVFLQVKRKTADAS